MRAILFRSTFSRTSILLYITFGLAPSALIELWFEKIGRPTYTSTSGGQQQQQQSSTATATRAGEDLEAKGLTEFLWDVVYWTWGCIGVAGVFGDRGWWLWLVVPLYSVYAAWTMYRGFSGQMGGLMGGGSKDGEGGGGAGGGESKRQKKLEKRGGQRIQYR